MVLGNRKFNKKSNAVTRDVPGTSNKHFDKQGFR